MDSDRPHDAGGGAPPAERLDRLALAAQRGDPAATSALLHEVAPRLLGVARAILGAGAPDIDDVAQESLIAFFDALPAFRAESSVRHYACRIAARIAIAARRRSREANERLNELGRTSVAPGALGSSLDADALAARRRELLRSLLSDLPEEQAEALALRVAMGYSMQEVAEATGAPLNTVRSRLRLAKEGLRKRVEADAAALELLQEGA